MNLTAILNDSYRRLGFGTSPGTEVVTRLTAFANLAIKEILSDPILQKSRNRTLPLVTVANVATAALPQAITDLFRIVNRTNQFHLVEVDQAWMREQDPGRLVTSTTPQNYAVVDHQSAIARQPADSSQLYVKSSSAGDVQTAYIEVVNSDGYNQQASVTVNGVTAALLGPSDSINVLDFYLSSVAVGEVTLLEDSGSGTELAKIGVNHTRERYLIIELFPIPSSAVTLHADVQMAITDLVNGTDEPLIEDEFCEAIVHGVRRREFDKREKPQLAMAAWRDAAPFLARMRHKEHKRAGRSNQGRPTRWSQLGPYYPPGS